MQEDTKTVLQTTDIAAHLKAAPKPLTDIELQQDYDYFMAQEGGCIVNRVNGNNLQYKIKGDNKS